MSSIIPTVFATSKVQFKERFDKLIKISDSIQIDFMDGSFVKSKSILPKQIPNLMKYNDHFEAHLMTYHPEKHITTLKNKGFKKIIFHFEAVGKRNIENVIKKIKKEKLSVFLAINPETPINSILEYIPRIDGVLFLGVHPGKEHQSFITPVYEKIRQLRKINKSVKIQVDGGVNESSLKKLASLKVNYLNSGSFISESANAKEAFNKLNSLFKKYQKR